MFLIILIANLLKYHYRFLAHYWCIIGVLLVYLECNISITFIHCAVLVLFIELCQVFECPVMSGEVSNVGFIIFISTSNTTRIIRYTHTCSNV